MLRSSIWSTRVCQRQRRLILRLHQFCKNSLRALKVRQRRWRSRHRVSRVIRRMEKVRINNPITKKTKLKALKINRFFKKEPLMTVRTTANAQIQKTPKRATTIPKSFKITRRRKKQITNERRKNQNSD